MASPPVGGPFTQTAPKGHSMDPPGMTALDGPRLARLAREGAKSRHRVSLQVSNESSHSDKHVLDFTSHTSYPTIKTLLFSGYTPEMIRISTNRCEFIIIY